MSKSSFSSVVSDLVRASMGSSIPDTVPDDELDRQVAELILKEAKQKAERYLQDGVRAYLPQPDSNAPKANKRFLSSIIQNTHEHNQAVIKAQAETAQEFREEREEQERKERRARANEATEAGRLRRLMGGSRRTDDDIWSRARDGKRRERSREPMSKCSDEERSVERLHKSKRRRSRSRDGDYERERRSRRHHRHGGDGDSDREPRHRRTSRSTSRTRSRHKHRSHRSRKTRSAERERERAVADSKSPKKSNRYSRSRSRTRSPSAGPSGVNTKSTTPPAGSTSKLGVTDDSRANSPQPRKQLDLNEQFRSRREKEKERERASPTLSEEEDIERARPRRKRAALTSIPQDVDRSRASSPDGFSTKMDRYFEKSYDPRLDTGPLTIPEVPSSGLINGADFEGWEAMLEVLRQRREYRAEKKRTEKMGLSSEKEKEKEKRKQETWGDDGGENILDIKYTKKGGVREWDMGKEGF